MPPYDSLTVKHTYKGFSPSWWLTLLTGGLWQQRQTRQRALGMQPVASTSGSSKESVCPPERKETKTRMRGTAALKDCISLELSRNVDAEVSLRQSPSKCQVVDLQKMAQAIFKQRKGNANLERGFKGHFVLSKYADLKILQNCTWNLGNPDADSKASASWYYSNIVK